jgi:hypothetical protein
MARYAADVFGNRAGIRGLLLTVFVFLGAVQPVPGESPSPRPQTDVAGGGPTRELMSGRTASRAGTEATVIRERGVEVDVALLRGVERGGGAAATFNFFDDASFPARFDRVHDERPADWHGLGTTWSGTLANDDGWFVLTIQRGVVTANAWTVDGRAFQIRTGADGGYVSQEIDLTRFEPCVGPVDPGPMDPADPGPEARGDGRWACPAADGAAGRHAV